VINLLVALVPVVAFLIALSLMDSFRLVRPRWMLAAIAWGACAAVATLWLHAWLLGTLHVPAPLLTRYVAPLTEETAKAVFIVGLVVSARMGFLVEACVQGFAVGTGFALIENLDYLYSIPSGTLALWVVRGLGTAMLQGATTAIFAMVSKTLADRRADRTAFAFVPGWVAAAACHSLFNHRLLPPLAQALVVLIVLPLLVLAVFARSERATREWIGAGMDVDLELLALVASESFGVTRFGRYLHELRTRLPGSIVADMFCLLRLELELSIQAKAMLMAREAGLELMGDDDLEASLAERRFLQESIGATGLLALKPLQVTSHRDRWHRHVLAGAKSRRTATLDALRPRA